MAGGKTTRINSANYLEFPVGIGKPSRSEAAYRNWLFVKHGQSLSTSYLTFGRIAFPKRLIGKRIRIKIEVMAEPSAKRAELEPETRAEAMTMEALATREAYLDFLEVQEKIKQPDKNKPYWWLQNTDSKLPKEDNDGN